MKGEAEMEVTLQEVAEINPNTVLTFKEWCQLIGVGGELDRVMSHKEWTKAAGISEKNGRELIERGDGPPTVQLSPNRIGVRVCDYRAWLTARTRNIAA
jgi:predicted DNA-binding transcriptional regulator AlpA